MADPAVAKRAAAPATVVRALAGGRVADSARPAVLVVDPAEALRRKASVTIAGRTAEHRARARERSSVLASLLPQAKPSVRDLDPEAEWVPDLEVVLLDRVVDSS